MNKYKLNIKEIMLREKACNKWRNLSGGEFEIGVLESVEINFTQSVSSDTLDWDGREFLWEDIYEKLHQIDTMGLRETMTRLIHVKRV